MKAIFLAVIIVVALSGCSALKDPKVWIPLAAAAVLQVNNYDEDLQEHLYDNAPVFGDAENAQDWGDELEYFTEKTYLATAVFTPMPVVALAQYASVDALDGAVGEMKSAVGRDRPTNGGDGSMPSGHATRTAYKASLTQTNVSYLDIDDGYKTAINYTVESASIMTAYSRVEAGAHYPSDVLVGYALGNLAGNGARLAISENKAALTFNWHF